MARPRNHQKHLSLAVEDLLRSIAGLVDAASTAIASSRDVKRAATGVKKSASATGKKISSAVKAAWAKLSPEDRAARIRKMHAWRKRK